MNCIYRVHFYPIIVYTLEKKSEFLWISLSVYSKHIRIHFGEKVFQFREKFCHVHHRANKHHQRSDGKDELQYFLSLRSIRTQLTQKLLKLASSASMMMMVKSKNVKWEGHLIKWVCLINIRRHHQQQSQYHNKNYLPGIIRRSVINILTVSILIIIFFIIFFTSILSLSVNHNINDITNKNRIYYFSDD